MDLQDPCSISRRKTPSPGLETRQVSEETVHGDKDRMVPYDQAFRLDTGLRKAGVTSYFVTVKRAGHGEFGVAANDRVKAFFDKYLQGKDVQISTATIENRKP
jgi:predicted esterase